MGYTKFIAGLPQLYIKLEPTFSHFSSGIPIVITGSTTVNKHSRNMEPNALLGFFSTPG